MDPSLRPIMEAFRAVRDDAANKLQALYQQFEGQQELLTDFLGEGYDDAKQQLDNIAKNGADAIPDGLRQDVIEAYNNLAQIVKDAPDELKPWVDPDGVQAMRANLTAQASELMSSAGLAAGGAAAATWWTAASTWWASLPVAASVALVTAGVLLLGAALYLGYKAISTDVKPPASPARVQSKCDYNAAIACQNQCSAQWDGKNALREGDCWVACKKQFCPDDFR